MAKVFILSSKRTPLGSFLGGLSTIPAPDLGGVAIDAALKDSGVSPDQVDSCYVGNVISAGLGQNLAKQAALKGGLPPNIPCTHVDKVCCSSLKALTLGVQEILLGDASCVVVAGTENMSMAPRLVSGSRQTQKMGPMTLAAETKAADAMIVDGLWDSFNDLHMGTLADTLAAEKGITREEQDQFALRSFARAREGWETGKRYRACGIDERRIRKVLSLCEDTISTVAVVCRRAIRRPAGPWGDRQVHGDYDAGIRADFRGRPERECEGDFYRRAGDRVARRRTLDARPVRGFSRKVRL